eukprot:scaffold49462_cov60-Phaeocystis_antarctica.AAC.2
MTALCNARVLSAGRAPRPRAAASAKAPVSPTFILLRVSVVTAGSAPAPSPSASRCTPRTCAPWARCSSSSTGRTDPIVPSVARSVQWILSSQSTTFASRSSLLAAPHPHLEAQR